MKFKDIFYEAKQLHPTGIISTTFLNSAGELNLYVQFVYGPQKMFNYTKGKLSKSMNADMINVNKQFNNQQ